MKTILSRLLITVAFLIILIIVIVYARGYRLDTINNSITSTGILSINSYPKAAKIYLNGVLKGITDQNISLPPGKYVIELKKDGYTSWKKTINLKGEIVESANGLLFPINPSLSPLTNLGITKTFAIGQSEKLLLFSQNDLPEKDGIYVFDLSKRNFSFFPPLRLITLKTSLPSQIDFNQTSVIFSPDLKQAIITFEIADGQSFSYLFSMEEENKQIFEVTVSKEKLTAAWDEEKNREIAKLLESFPKDMQKIASDSFYVVSFSFDKQKILYQAKNNIELPLIIKPRLIATNQTLEERNLVKDSLYVYDQKEDKNFLISSNQNLPLWYPDSEHLVISESGNISVVEYDNQNKQIVYSGPYEQDFLSVTMDGKLLILTNLNSKSNKLPDIYTVGIK